MTKEDARTVAKRMLKATNEYYSLECLSEPREDGLWDFTVSMASEPDFEDLHALSDLFKTKDINASGSGCDTCGWGSTTDVEGATLNG